MGSHKMMMTPKFQETIVGTNQATALRVRAQTGTRSQVTNHLRRRSQVGTTPARRIQRAGSTLRRTGATTVRLRAGITLRLRTADLEPTFRANPFKRKRGSLF